MSKFKVGDKVKILAVELPDPDEMGHLIGTHGVVDRLENSDSRPIVVQCSEGNEIYWFSKDELELIEDNTNRYEVWAGETMHRRYNTEAEAIAWAEGADSQDPYSPGYRVYKVTRELIKEIGDD